MPLYSHQGIAEFPLVPRAEGIDGLIVVPNSKNSTTIPLREQPDNIQITSIQVLVLVDD